MFLRIDTNKPKTLLGMNVKTTLGQNLTGKLWSGFMPRLNEISKRTGTDLYSVQCFPVNHNFGIYDPDAEFEKWACAEVSDFSQIPDGMQTLIIPEGEYAVFLHKGNLAAAFRTYQYIFAEWLPQSAMAVDHRPHFEIIGPKYKNDHPDSEEEIWIPVKQL